MARDADGALIGMAFLKPVQDRAGEIKRKYVVPSARGTGLGRKLLTRLIDEARAMEFDSILLDSVSSMTVAHALYRSMGFQDIDGYPESENDPALADHLVYMRLILNEVTADPAHRAPR